MSHFYFITIFYKSNYFLLLFYLIFMSFLEKKKIFLLRKNNLDKMKIPFLSQSGRLGKCLVCSDRYISFKNFTHVM